MGSYSIEWKPSAVKELRKLPKVTLLRILAAVEKLATDPVPRGSRKLARSDHSLRIRIGEYRVLYRVLSSRLVVEVIRVGHRKDVYSG